MVQYKYNFEHDVYGYVESEIYSINLDLQIGDVVFFDKGYDVYGKISNITKSFNFSNNMMIYTIYLEDLDRNEVEEVDRYR